MTMAELEMCGCGDPDCSFHTVVVCSSGASSECAGSWQRDAHPDWPNNDDGGRQLCGPCRDEVAAA